MTYSHVNVLPQFYSTQEHGPYLCPQLPAQWHGNYLICTCSIKWSTEGMKQRQQWGCVGGEWCNFRRTARGLPQVCKDLLDTGSEPRGLGGRAPTGDAASTQILKWEPASRVQGKANAPMWQEQNKQEMRAERKWGAAKRTASDRPMWSLEGLEQSAMSLHILTRSPGLLGWE